MAKHVDGFVSREGVLLATRDYDGAGSPAILLLHGSGRSLADWAPMASDLTQHHRVVAMDVRGHGFSEAGRWDIRALMADIEAVLNYYGMPSAALAGTSMGGVLAHLFAAGHPETTAVINFDGFSLRPDEHVGLSPAVVAERQARVLAEYKWSRASFSADELKEKVEAWAERYHQPKGLIEESFQRVFRQDQDKTFYHREEEITAMASCICITYI
jgi:pimeloyl-ACP methyl ester carboxylesterase